MTDLYLRDVTEDDARAFAAWEYPEPYALYNGTPDDVALYLDPANDYHAVVDDGGEVVGECCFGRDARVSGGTYDDEAIDIGAGMRPDLVGQGRGRQFVTTIIEHAERRFRGRPLRVTIAAFNERAQRLWLRAGFEEAERFRSLQGREFLVCVRAAYPDRP